MKERKNVCHRVVFFINPVDEAFSDVLVTLELIKTVSRPSDRLNNNEVWLDYIPQHHQFSIPGEVYKIIIYNVPYITMQLQATDYGALQSVVVSSRGRQKTHQKKLIS